MECVERVVVSHSKPTFVDVAIVTVFSCNGGWVSAACTRVGCPHRDVVLFLLETQGRPGYHARKYVPDFMCDDVQTHLARGSRKSSTFTRLGCLLHSHRGTIILKNRQLHCLSLLIVRVVAYNIFMYPPSPSPCLCLFLLCVPVTLSARLPMFLCFCSEKLKNARDARERTHEKEHGVGRLLRSVCGKDGGSHRNLHRFSAMLQVVAD